MARIEWVQARLNNWALWKEREGSGGLGFSSQSVLLSEVVDRYREVPLPVDDPDAEVTNQAVESLRGDRPHLYRTLELIYIKDCGEKEAARVMDRTDRTIRQYLEDADHVIARWLQDYKAVQDAKRRAYKA